MLEGDPRQTVEYVVRGEREKINSSGRRMRANSSRKKENGEKAQDGRLKEFYGRQWTTSRRVVIKLI